MGTVSKLSNVEKLAYLKHALNDGSARHVVEGLSGSGDHYKEAVDCLRKRYDRPRLIHKAHVRAILETPPLKDGNGRELRRLHDTVNQHLRALKATEHEPDGPFITSMLELKLDQNTMFEWHKFSQASEDVPHCAQMLEFLNLRAQASESSVPGPIRKRLPEDAPGKRGSSPRSVTSYVASVSDSCVACKTGKHPLYACQKYKSLPHDQMTAIVKSSGLCFNCLKPGHMVNRCPSNQRCRKCQRLHHSLLHLETGSGDGGQARPPSASSLTNPTTVLSHVARADSSHRHVLLMTSHVLVVAPDGSTTRARALLDSASSTSFISEHLAQHMRLHRRREFAQIAGIGGVSQPSLSQSVVRLGVTHPTCVEQVIDVDAVVLPRVTSDLPLCPIPFDSNWRHLSGLRLADPDFGSPGSIDLLLGADVFSTVVLHGRRLGPTGSPSAFETRFGWVLTGAVDGQSPQHHVVSYHASVLTGDDLLRRFWEVEERGSGSPSLSHEERSVVDHFRDTHQRDQAGRFVVQLPRRQDTKPFGESRSTAVQRFLSLERSLISRGQHEEFSGVIEEYFDMDHAELVPNSDLEKPCEQVFYMPMHAVVKASSTTTKVRAVFDASAKSASGVSLNDQLLVGPTVHVALVDVLLRFRLHRIALATDVSRMYRAILLPDSERDLHRFVWRRNPTDPLKDFRMTRLTFGVSASSFAANMAVKQNAIDFAEEFPLAASAVHASFYVDDGLVGADSAEEATRLQQQLQELFSRGGFLLRKWKSSAPDVPRELPPHLLDESPSQALPDPDGFSKALGVEWSTNLDCFRLTVAHLSPKEVLSKRALISDVARTYDVLGWYAPAIITLKILFQRLWEDKLEWDDPVPLEVQEQWERWRKELSALVSRLIPRCYFPKQVNVTSTQLHGFSDASEAAYAGVVYLRMVDSEGGIHVSLVMAKTKVAPIKRLTVPRLELCGAKLLAELICHVQGVLNIPSSLVFAWTDSTVVLGWLSGKPRRFKTFVGNRVSAIMDLVPPKRWRHVSGKQNPADCASRGLFPCELLEFRLWWDGPDWLHEPESSWPLSPIALPLDELPESEETRQEVSHVITLSALPLLDRFSSFTRLKRVTAWVRRFVGNSRARSHGRDRTRGPLSSTELADAETYWVATVQVSSFPREVSSLRRGSELSPKSKLLPLRPFLDRDGVLRVGGRAGLSRLSFSKRHPIILPGTHVLAKLLIAGEHQRLLHGGPSLVAASLSRRFHVLGSRRAVRSVTRSCITCRRASLRPQPQMLGQLPADRLVPGSTFQHVGVDYAGPVLLKSGSVRKPTLTKAYACVFVSFAVKAVHLELVSDLTSEAFLAALRRFVARRGKPSTVWSDNGTNFVGAAHELKELQDFLGEQETQRAISDYCATRGIEWKHIPERAPHFGGLWEAAVKSMKRHLRKIVGNVRLTYEELATVLTQVEACLNSRPLTPMPESEDGIEVLTPGHFLVGSPLESIPDPSASFRTTPLLRRWHLCQALVRHFWQRWSSEYVQHLHERTKWKSPTRNARVGDLVCIREDGLTPTTWPLARVTAVHPGADGLVRVVSVRTPRGEYKRPVAKVVLLLPA